ncbi:MAG: HDIG domain-containing protein [Bdellovibrionota bacterium]
MKRFSVLLEKFPEKLTPAVAKAALLLLTAIAVSVMLSSLVWDFEKPVTYYRGDIARQTIRAPHDLIVEDSATTEQRRAEALGTVAQVFTRQAVDPLERISRLFAYLEDVSGESLSHEGRVVLTQEQRLEYERKFGLDLVAEEWHVVENRANWESLQSSVATIVEPIIAKGVLPRKQTLRAALNSGKAVLRNAANGKEEELFMEGALYDMQEALGQTKLSFPNTGFGRSSAFDSLVQKLAAASIHPNVFFDSEETSHRLKLARERVEASVLRIQRGQVIVRAGDLVTAAQQSILEQFQEQRNITTLFRVGIGYFLLTVALLFICYLFAATYWPGFAATTKDLALISATLCGTFFLLKVFSILATSLSYSFSDLDANSLLAMTPLAAGGILLQSTIGGPAVFVFTLTSALLTGVFLDSSWLLLLFIVCGNFVGAISVQRCSRRSSFIYAGTQIAAINAFVAAAYLLFYPQISSTEGAARLLVAILGGIQSGLLAGALTPFAEFFGGYITDIKLLELASLDRPLLRELSLQAPGTWNHSMVMGQIAEAAAESIGANPLLARVGAFYHDIGKTKKPAYFVENQLDRNRHDKLTPSMSALIIKAHVKDGIEMAQEHRLPQALIDFIPQHHGNSLIEYFYEKALRETEDGEVDESHYRYPGPRPQTKEAGILMLADAVEASSRTLSDPAPAKIQGLVQKIINKVFASGELNECNLTLQDLHLIAKSFTRVLTGIYHRRIEYSEPAEKTRDTRPVRPRTEEPLEQEIVVERDGSPTTERSQLGHDTISPGSPLEVTEPLKRLGMH